MDAAISERTGVATEAVGPLLRLAEAKLATATLTATEAGGSTNEFF